LSVFVAFLVLKALLGIWEAFSPGAEFHIGQAHHCDEGLTLRNLDQAWFWKGCPFTNDQL